MLPLIGLALKFAPDLANWIWGPKAEATTQAVTQAVQTVTGTIDPDAARQLLARDPDMASQLQVELAKIAAQASADQRAADQAELAAQLADVASARQQTVALAQTHSAVQWAAPIVSIVVTVGFFFVLWLVFSGRSADLPANQQAGAMLLLGTLTAGFGAVVQFWLGSSAGSRAKDSTLAAAQQALANSVPANTNSNQ